MAPAGAPTLLAKGCCCWRLALVTKSAGSRWSEESAGDVDCQINCFLLDSHQIASIRKSI